MKIFDTSEIRMVCSPDYNYLFRKRDGFCMRWGKTKEDDPQVAPAPELADIEISTICHQNCPACYKTNTSKGENMSLDTFKRVFDKLCWQAEDGKKLPFISQIAFGIGSIDANPEMWAMFEHCRENDVVPNVTINGSRMTPEYFDNLARLCGAVAVSHYDDDTCFNAVQELTQRGLRQVNVHQLLASETLEQCHSMIEAKLNDPRLEKLNAIVFLTLKPKGERNHYRNVSCRNDYVTLIKHAVEKKVSFGFDSCFAPIFMDVAKDIYEGTDLTEVSKACEYCESGCFSLFADVRGNFVPCSFCPNQAGIEPISILKAADFIKDVWNNPQTVAFRENLLKGGRGCPVFPAIYDYKGTII